MADCDVVYHEQMVTARREHQCYECNRPIVKGATYERITGKWMDIPGSGFATYRFCADCILFLHWSGYTIRMDLGTNARTDPPGVPRFRRCWSGYPQVPHHPAATWGAQ